MSAPQSNIQNTFFGVRVSKVGVPVNQAGPNDLLFTNDYSSEVFYDQFGVPRVQLGEFEDGNYGLKVSLPNENVLTSNNLAFNSQQLTGTITYPSQLVASGDDYVQNTIIPHNLGYVPDYSVIALAPGVGNGGATVDLYQDMSIFGQSTDDNFMTYTYLCGVDASNLYIFFDVNNSDDVDHDSTPTTAQYYIIQSKVAS